MKESSHVDGSSLVIDDQPIINPGTERRHAPDHVDPVRAARSILRRWRLLLLIMIIGTALGWLSATVADEADTAPVEVDHYQGTHVLVVDGNVPTEQTTLSVRNLNTLAKRVTVGQVPDDVAETLSITAAQARSQVRVVIRSDSESMDIITVAETPAMAEMLADTYAAELFNYLNAEAESFAQEGLALAQGRLDEAEANLQRVRSELRVARQGENADAIDLLEQDEEQFLNARVFANAALLDVRADGVPVVPLESLKPAADDATIISSGRFNGLVDRASLGRNIEVLFGDEVEEGMSNGALSAVSSRIPQGHLPRMLAGLGLGALVGLFVLVLLNRIDNRVRSKAQVERLLDLPVVAEIPNVGRRKRRRTELLSVSNPRSRFAEQYRVLASTVTYARRSRPNRHSQVVLVTSPGPAEGKTTTVANLGAMLAEAGQSVLMINCDFRRPRLHLHMGADSEPRDVHPTEIPDIELIANVTENHDAAPTEVVAEQRELIRKARQFYDLILIDTAPLLATNDAVDLLDLVDDVVLVLKAGKTTAHAADRASEMLERRRSHVLGVAITGVDSRSSDDYYYYHGSYYYDGDGNRRNRRAANKNAKRERTLLRFGRKRKITPLEDPATECEDETMVDLDEGESAKERVR
ncbi:MAG: hypothetical protein HKN94_02070 [Acidimicrobiales bacterium]|nr:hypothetical protein [Acidimicrobiales bacterium]